MLSILNYVQLSQLRHALIVAEEGSFIRAGKRLNTHYSQVSRKIRTLEETVGIMIFHRKSNGVTPTPEGADFLQGIRRVMVDLESVLRQADIARTGAGGSLSIGFYVSILEGELCDIVKQYIGLYPEVSLQFLEAPRPELAAAMNNHAIDVKISTSRANVGDSSLPLWRESVLVALSAGHPLAEKPVIGWEDLAKEKIILRRHEPGNELRDLLRTRIGDASEVRIVHHDVGRDSLLGLVRRHDGIALVYETDTGIGHPDIIYRGIQANGRSAQVRYMAHWRSDNPNPALRSFIRLLHERYIFAHQSKP